jgi:hypothetical protein
MRMPRAKSRWTAVRVLALAALACAAMAAWSAQKSDQKKKEIDWEEGRDAESGSAQGTSHGGGG